MTTAAFTWKVTITTGSNDAIDFKEDAGVEQNATLDAGTYEMFGADDAAGDTIAKEIKTQLEATGAGTYAVSVSSAGLMSITVSVGASAVQITWANGTNEATSAKHVTGYGDADTASAATVTAASQVHGVFLFHDSGPDMAADSEDQAEKTSPQHMAMDGGVVERPLGSFRYDREIEIALIPRAKRFKSTNNAKSIEDMFEYLRGGNSRVVRLYADPSVQTSYDTYHVAPASGSIDNLKRIARINSGVERWGGPLRLLKYVA